MDHYNKDYFNWQKKIGVIGGILNKFKFEKHIDNDDIIMDFGCGSGYLLSNFNNKIKIGFEINRHAWDECKNNNIKVYDNFNDIKDNSIDKIISNHAMEHVPLPLESLKNLYNKLKKGGKIIIVIPCEQPNQLNFYYKKNDINQHLHTWCPMTFGNLCTLAGFNVISCDIFQHQWIPNYKNEYLNPDIHNKCINFAKKNGNIQIKLIATKD